MIDTLFNQITSLEGLFNSEGKISPSQVAIAAIAMAGSFVGFQLLRINQQMLTDPIPGPPTRFLVGNIFDVNPLFPTESFAKLALKYGPIFRFYVFGKRLVIISDPETIKYILTTKNFPKTPEHYDGLKLLLGDGLLTAEGARWKKHRAICNMTFHKNSLKELAVFISDSTKAMISSTIETSDAPIDILSMFNKFAIEVIFRTTFGSDITTFLKDPDGFINLTRDATELIHFYNSKPLWRFFHPLEYLKLRKIASYIRRTWTESVANRRQELLANKNETTSVNMLNLMLNTKDDENANLSNSEVVDNIATFMFAGSETTAVTLTWVCYHLTQNKEAYEKLKKEIDEAFAKNGGAFPSFDEINQLRYITMVIKETLRITPAVGGGTRYVNEDGITLHGYPIAKGSIVTPSYFVTNYNPQIYPNPEKFDPERFNPSVANERHPYAFSSFSGGPRICIGMPFAYLEMKIALCAILKDYDFTLVGDNSFQMRQVVTIRPKNTVMLKFVKRK